MTSAEPATSRSWGPARGCNPERLRKPTEYASHFQNEQRHAVHRSLYDRSEDQPLFRLRTHIAGNRAMAPDGKLGAAGCDGAACQADGGRGAATASDRNRLKHRLTDSFGGDGLW